MQRRKVLIVDDDEVVLAVVQAWLVAEGHDVLTHSTPFGTTNVVRAVEPHVVLLDVSMPGLPGEAVAELLRKMKQGQDLKIIFFSGAPMERLAALSIEYSASGWIHKTSDRATFLEQFNRLVGATEAVATTRTNREQ